MPERATIAATDARDSAPDYPTLVATWIAQTIPELEQAIHSGTLTDLIERPDVQEAVGPALVERYRAIASMKAKHDMPFRRNWVLRFIEGFEQSLRAPRKLFPAKATKPWSVDIPLPHRSW